MSFFLLALANARQLDYVALRTFAEGIEDHLKVLHEDGILS